MRSHRFTKSRRNRRLGEFATLFETDLSESDDERRGSENCSVKALWHA